MEEKENNKQQNKIRKVFLDDLPKRGKRVDWKNSIGYRVKFIYDDIEGELEIVDYNFNNKKLSIKYLDKPIYIVYSVDFLYCGIGRLLDKRTSNFRVEVGQVFKDEKRNLIITDREHRKDKKGQNCKWYKYTCNKCGWTEGWIEESNLLQSKYGCSCCANKTIVQGINDIPTTAPWMVKYFQGGYDEAKMYSCQSSKKIFPICVDCGRIKDKSMIISNIYKRHSIECNCSDNTPYAEKVLYSLLEQLNLDFKTQLTKTTFEWCDDYKYDFYFEYNNKQYIIETHGEQHYKEKSRKGARTLKEEQANDRYKIELAMKNGIKEENYIVIDCRESNLEFIKQNIINSKLNEVFDLSIIDWYRVEEFALSNRVKEACEYKKENPNITTTEIGKIMKLSRSTIIKYLKRGSKLGYCNYNVEEELKKSGINSGKSSGKSVEIFKNDISLGVFLSGTELERQSEMLFGIKLNHTGISQVASGKWEHYKKFTFKYVDKDITTTNIRQSA